MSRAHDAYGAKRLAAVADTGRLKIARATMHKAIEHASSIAEVLRTSGGRPIEYTADEKLAGMLGALLVRWWFEGPHSELAGKPFNWTETSTYAGGATVVGDLRVLLGKSLHIHGHMGILSRLGVYAGQAVYMVDPATIGDAEAIDMGRCLQAWSKDPTYEPLNITFTMPKRDKPDERETVIQRFDIRPLVLSALRGFAEAVRLEAAGL